MIFLSMCPLSFSAFVTSTWPSLAQYGIAVGLEVDPEVILTNAVRSCLGNV